MNIFDTLVNTTCASSTTISYEAPNISESIAAGMTTSILAEECDTKDLEGIATAGLIGTSFISNCSDTFADLKLSNDYINALDIEELAEFEQRLDEKFLEYEIPNQEGQEKVYTKS